MHPPTRQPPRETAARSRTVGRRRLLAGLATLAFGCKREASSEDAIIALNGAGATFPFPLYSKWIAEYNREHPKVRINYQSIGSGGGIRQIAAGTVDFGATDTPMTREEQGAAEGKLVHVPTAIGSVVVSYLLPGVTEPVKLSQEAVAGIFLGEITRWNHALLTRDNPGLAPVDLPIAVVNRTDGSGTTAIFTDYLARVSRTWQERVGVGRNVRWPTGLGAKGNEGVTGQLISVPGAIGYTELAYATQNGLPQAAIRNRAGLFVAPGAQAATAAALAVPMPDSLSVSLVDAPGERSYPIGSYTYVIVFSDTEDAVKGRALARFLWWATHSGQRFASELEYAPLPAGVVERVEKRLRALRAGGGPALPGG